MSCWLLHILVYTIVYILVIYSLLHRIHSFELGRIVNRGAQFFFIEVGPFAPPVMVYMN